MSTPVIRQARDIKPNFAGSARNIKPNLNSSILSDTTTVYFETRNINQGQSIPWGLNWLITYPNSLVFQAQRP